MRNDLQVEIKHVPKRFSSKEALEALSEKKIGRCALHQCQLSIHGYMDLACFVQLREAALEPETKVGELISHHCKGLFKTQIDSCFGLQGHVYTHFFQWCWFIRPGVMWKPCWWSPLTLSIKLYHIVNDGWTTFSCVSFQLLVSSASPSNSFCCSTSLSYVLGKNWKCCEKMCEIRKTTGALSNTLWHIWRHVTLNLDGDFATVVAYWN